MSLLGLPWESSPPGELWSFLRASGRMRSPNPIFLSPPVFCRAPSTGEGPSSQGIPKPRRRPSGLPDLIGQALLALPRGRGSKHPGSTPASEGHRVLPLPRPGHAMGQLIAKLMGVFGKQGKRRTVYPSHHLDPALTWGSPVLGSPGLEDLGRGGSCVGSPHPLRSVPCPLPACSSRVSGFGAPQG